MSNKLYTEEELQVAYNIGHMDGRINNIDYSITDSFAPIELPSDDEIDNRSYSDEEEKGFRAGAKWMRDQIKGDKNEQ